MNFKELKELIEIVSSRESIEELEVERAGVRLRVRRAASQPAAKGEAPPLPARPREVVDSGSDPAKDTAVAEPEGVSYVTSPMVGTFYRASSPDAEPFVKVGDFVEKGTVVCIIEAMKLMNEIESDLAGEIVGISVEIGHPVEYGERLFAVRPR